VVSGRCPTFHWTAVTAKSIDLVVYRVPLEDSGGVPERVLAVSLPGAADGWTPALGQCFEAETRYAWSVGTGGEWSEASLFEVSAAPSVPEVEEAMAVLRRFVSDGEPSTAPVEASEPEATEPRLPPRVLRSETTGGRPESTGPASGASPAVPSTTPSLVVDDEIHLSHSSDIFRGGESFLRARANNLAVGKRALEGMTGSDNTAVGQQTLVSNTTGHRNSAFGRAALYANETGSHNSAFGRYALVLNTSGSHNSVFGENALKYNTSGSDNSALGRWALARNTEGPANTAVGYRALYLNTTARGSTAVGWTALESSDTDANTAVGHEALRYATGDRNTAVGEDALRNVANGSRNVAVGEDAGVNLTEGSDNIFILNTGAADDDDTIKIGTEGTQDRTFIAGVNGGVLANPNVPVMVDGFGKLGTTTSSRRYKQDIRDLGVRSERLLDLRPVTFRYRAEAIAGDSPITFGLIAEEVAEVMPELVVYDPQGRPEAVSYHLLSSLLLNELQKQHREMQLHRWALVVMFLSSVALIVFRRQNEVPK
jgi:hypothetical protein